MKKYIFSIVKKGVAFLKGKVYNLIVPEGEQEYERNL